MKKKFYDFCKKNNLKVTPQRIEIYKIVINSKEHPSLSMVYKSVKKKFPNISIDTVYRTLRKFVEIGIVKEVENYEDFRRYDGFTENHHHFHCIKCYKIFDIPYNEVGKLSINDFFNKNFEILDYKIILKGICKKCKSKKENTKNPLGF